MTSPIHDVAIVGAGHNALVSAFYLARAGLDVAVFERRDVIGGACVSEELIDGYTFSTCANLSWLLQPRIVEDMQLNRHGLNRFAIDPETTMLEPEGRGFSVWRDEERTTAELRRVSRQAADALPEWNRFWTRAAELVHAFYLGTTPTLDELWKHAESVGESALLEQLLSESLGSIVADYFDDPFVQAALAAVDDYGDPWLPGSAFSEAYSHCDAFSPPGRSFVAGGMGSITVAMATAAQEAGAVISTGKPVDQILVDENGRATGLRFDDGSEVRAATIVSGADPRHTFLTLLDAQADTVGVGEWARDIEARSACLKFHSVTTELPRLPSGLFEDDDPRRTACVKIISTLDDYASAHTACQRGEVPERLVIGAIMIPTIYEPTLARRTNNHTVSMWIPYVPSRPLDGSWNGLRDDAATQLIGQVDAILPNYRDSVQSWVLLTPEDIQERTGLTGGNIHHIDMRPGQLIDGRAPHESLLPGLFLCGAGTHPAGEVTGAPGYNAARAVLEHKRQTRQSAGG